MVSGDVCHCCEVDISDLLDGQCIAQTAELTVLRGPGRLGARLSTARGKLEVTLAASDAGRVRLYFSNGDSIDDVSLIEKDDTVLLAFDGGACVRS